MAQPSASREALDKLNLVKDARKKAYHAQSFSSLQEPKTHKGLMHKLTWAAIRCIKIYNSDPSPPVFNDILKQVEKYKEMVLSSLSFPSFTVSLSLLLDSSSPADFYDASTGIKGQESRLLEAMKYLGWKEGELPRYLETYRDAMQRLATTTNSSMPPMPPLHNLLLLIDKQLQSWLLSGFPVTEERDLFGRYLLHLALDLGIGDDATHLLSTTRDVDIWSRHPLHIASSTGFINIIMRLIHNKCDLELEDCDRLQALHYASAAGHEDIVRLLVDEASIDPLDSFGRTPLSHGARNGHTAVVSLLVEKGANIESEDECGWTPLSHAIDSGRMAVVELLLKNGASARSLFEGVGQKMSDFGERHLAVLKLLLKSGTLAEYAPSSIRELLSLCGETALSYASELGELGVVVKLLEAKVNLNWKAWERELPLWYAVRARNAKIVEKLLTHGADPNSTSLDGRSALAVAIEQGDQEIIEMLLDSGADPA
ncbi:hypothetical protein NM208_g11112 [Fusarium decemcellulare]|uniref:Uncharacterized protein n=1 Tax=Fusarium decemcellulare TaxID=57161 RepID=A0ACC1RVG9_9HYPO|nr:hypothetical protein NM208_g11112 [Fusarium decemcellulare]